MNHDRMILWAEALETTDSKQGTGCLRNKADERCCLGVAVEVAILNGCEVEVLPPTHWSPRYLYDGRGIDLPNSVITWYGFKDEDYPSDPQFGENSYSQLNDILGKSFHQIAAVVRRHAAEARGVYSSGLPETEVSQPG